MNVEGTPRLDPAALRRGRRRVSTPWAPEHHGRLVLGNLVAVVLIVTAWVQMSGTGSVRTQFAWMNLSLVAIVVAGVANGLYLFSGLTTVALAKDQVLQRARHLAPAAQGADEDLGGELTVLVHVPGTTRYHRAGCLTVLGKPVEPTTGPAGSSLVGCPVCRP